MITAATSAKIAIEIAVTNQKTKSIRPACSLAPCGSQGIRSATAAAPAPKTAPIATSWTTDPLGPVEEPLGLSELRLRVMLGEAGAEASLLSAHERPQLAVMKLVDDVEQLA